MNIRRRAVTQYHGFLFNSMCLFNNMPVCLSDSAIYKFGHEYQNDDGTNIDCFATFVATDFGIANHKHLRSTHVSYVSDGKIILTYKADDVSYKAEEVLSEVRSTTYRDIKVKGNRKVEGTYFEFKVENYRGSDLTLNSIRAVPIIRNLGTSN